MPAPASRPKAFGWLYNHNPFYAISAVLMLFAVQSAYRETQIGMIDCGIMMAVLAGYTSLLAFIGVFIVRRGKVWEDARSIFVLLLILFLAVSISADDLFVKMESPLGGAALLTCGYVFSAVVSELVLCGARVRLALAYRLPYHLLLALFYVAPWWCAPTLHPRTNGELEWTILAFPVAAGVLLLTLLPAVRRGPVGVSDNGTPWSWPWFPWTAFGVVIAAVALRTFALSMTFGPSGPIWVTLSSGRQGIAYDTMWGPYFLIPPAFAVLVLFLEAGLVTRNETLIRRVLVATPLLLMLAFPWFTGAVFRGFLTQVTEKIGAPLWLAAWLQLALYASAWLRGVSKARGFLLASVAVFSIVGPGSMSLRTLTVPSPWPLAVVGAVLLVDGLWHRSSRICTAGASVLTSVLWISLPDSLLANFRMTICFHLLWIAIVAFGLAYRDRFAELLRMTGACLMPIASAVAMGGDAAQEVPVAWRVGYVLLLAATCLAIARIWRVRWYLFAFLSLIGIAGYGGTVIGFRGAVTLLGRKAMTSFLWSVAALLTAVLISAHKAGWLPERFSGRRLAASEDAKVESGES